jgi:hypothetical protein
MKKIFTVVVCLIFLALFVRGDIFDTRDRGLDSLLGDIDQWAKADPDAFILQISQQHNVMVDEVRRAQQELGLRYADMYMATALASRVNRPVRDVAVEYKQNQGKGWGALAISMGIKPGSSAFKALKANARHSVKHMKKVVKAKKRQQKKDIEKERKLKGKSQGKGQG